MPKQKTHKGLTKRVKVTGRRKVMRRKSFVGHLLSGRTARRKRRLHRSTTMVKAGAKRVLRALGR